MYATRAAALGFAAVLAGACSETPLPSTAPPTVTSADLATVTVEAAHVVRETVFDGVIEAVHRSTIAAQTSGRVVDLKFDVGDVVEQGAVVVRLTSAEQSARAEAAESALAEARARLQEARLAHDRTKDIYEKKLIAKARFDEAVSNLDSARARFDAAEAALAQAREGLSYTVVRAPFSGSVVARHVQIGETVTPGRPLMTGLSLENLRAVVEVPQQHINALRSNREARVVLNERRAVIATDLRIPPNADPVTHTFRVLMNLPPGDHGVFPGMLIKIAVASGEQRRLMVPGSAVVRRGEVTGVYVVDGAGLISLRYLRTGTPDINGRVPVLAGLTIGERVATDPIAATVAYKKQFSPGGDT